MSGTSSWPRRRWVSVCAAAALTFVMLGGAGLFSAAAEAGSLTPMGGPAAVAPQESTLRPSDLVGFWKVSGKGIAPKTFLRLSDRDLSLYDDSCGGWRGSWKARSSGLFVASIHGSHMSCTLADPVWLEPAVGFRRDGANRELLDVTGQVVVRLKPSAGIKPRDFAIPEYFKSPVLSQEAKDRLDKPPAAPQFGFIPANRQVLSGRWVPAAVAAERRIGATYLELADNGKWRGQEQCTGTYGRWVVGSDGTILATTSGWNLVWCRKIPVTHWLGEAAWAGFRGPTLVLVDEDGHDLGQLVPDIGTASVGASPALMQVRGVNQPAG